MESFPGWAGLLASAAAGAVVAALIAWLLTRLRSAARLATAAQVRAALEVQYAQAGERLRSTSDDLAQLRRQHEALQQQAGQWRDALDEATNEQARLTERSARMPALESSLADAHARIGVLTDELTELRARGEAERRHAEEKLQLLVEARDALGDQFKALAADILEEKSRRFAEQNQASLGQLLEPLRTRLVEFQGKVEEVYVQEGKDRSALSAQVRQLVQLNQALSEDAKNLTQALKGSAKTQGNWGELVLERVLEGSGLCKGREYHVQDSQTRDDGSRAQPDVVIDLPEERKLVVDSKVSLVAYERYVSSETDEKRAAALRQHLDSVRAHIKALSEKRYNELYGIQSLDFVLAFVPIEPAFMTAVTHDGELFMDAWRRNVLLVSPSTLLFVVRTVAHLWRQEAQTRNAQDIARRGAELYDKFCGFVTDLQKVGEKLGQAQQAYEDAQNKLSRGKGNVVRQAEMLRELGVKPSKALPAPLVEAAGEEAGERVGVEPGFESGENPDVETHGETREEACVETREEAGKRIREDVARAEGRVVSLAQAMQAREAPVK